MNTYINVLALAAVQIQVAEGLPASGVSSRQAWRNRQELHYQLCWVSALPAWAAV